MDQEFDHVKFVREREEVLLSLDKDKILSFCRKYGIYHPHTETAFWQSVHKARIALKDFPEPAKEISRRWLTERGFQADADVDERIETDIEL